MYWIFFLSVFIGMWDLLVGRRMWIVCNIILMRNRLGEYFFYLKFIYKIVFKFINNNNFNGILIFVCLCFKFKICIVVIVVFLLWLLICSFVLFVEIGLWYFLKDIGNFVVVFVVIYEWNFYRWIFYFYLIYGSGKVIICLNCW